MSYLETNTHLYNRAQYSVMNGPWTLDYEKSIDSNNNLTIDKTSIASFISFSQILKNRTLFKEIKRLEWMSEPMKGGVSKNLLIPPHGFKTAEVGLLSKLLFEKLCDEARTVIQSNPNIYILLTGGLDSRIIAGVFSYLYNNGEIKQKPKCVTWGLEDSRDVFYAKKMAEALNFEWQHIPLGPEDVMNNIKKCGKYLGLLHSPEMLHSMLWFKNIPSDAMVIAASFGDSIGRGEFSNKHLLYLNHKQPKNTYGLLTSNTYAIESKNLKEDLKYLYERGNNTEKYVQCEYWMQGSRMRNTLCHSLSVINRYANIYQMFTAPEVFSFIWSIHPSIRGNEIYTYLLKNYFPKLAEVPWARNNKAIKGSYKEQKLKPHYHEYTKWSSGVLYKDIKELIDPDWFVSKQIFNPYSIKEMNALVLKSKERVGRLNDIWLWLAGFRYYIDELESEGKIIDFKLSTENKLKHVPNNKKFNLKEESILLASKSISLNNNLKKIREKYRELDTNKKKREALKKYPPVPYA